jgi:membrane protein implicated in regulation of membrane protease activity
MWLYPIPAIVSLLLWLYVFTTGSAEGIVFSIAFLAAAVSAYFVFERSRRPQPAASAGRTPTGGAGTTVD